MKNSFKTVMEQQYLYCSIVANRYHSIFSINRLFKKIWQIFKTHLNWTITRNNKL